MKNSPEKNNVNKSLKSRYKCLVLDHDDTAVNSTPEIHYPSFVEILKELRPHIQYSLEEFTTYCFNPGFSPLCKDILKLTDEEMKIEYRIWKSYTSTRTPRFFEGFADMVKRFQSGGGYVSIISHSDSEDIKRHYAEQGIVPDLIYGWEYPETKRKPHPFPLLETMQILGVKPEECIVLDDLRLGYDMAKACNVEFAACGWSHLFDNIRDYMKEHSDRYFNTVAEFEDYIFRG